MDRISRAKGLDHGAVVPELVRTTAVEAFPSVGADRAKSPEDVAGVVELVGGDDEAGSDRLVSHAFDVRLLSPFPLRLAGASALGVGAGVDDVENLLAEPDTDRLAILRAEVLDRVVEEGGDRLGLRTAVVEDEAGDSEEVRGVRDVGAFSELIGVEGAGVGEGFVESASCHRGFLPPGRV
jgi:hypothetical protein